MNDNERDNDFLGTGMTVQEFIGRQGIKPEMITALNRIINDMLTFGTEDSIYPMLKGRFENAIGELAQSRIEAFVNANRQVLEELIDKDLERQKKVIMKDLIEYIKDRSVAVLLD